MITVKGPLLLLFEVVSVQDTAQTFSAASDRDLRNMLQRSDHSKLTAIAVNVTS